ncbi:MAG: GNAT family N-acetyltransferase [Shimia sp.]
MTYTFRPVTRGDYPLLVAWLAEPHIGGWWGAPETEIALIDEELDGDRVDERLVCLDGHPFAYVQDYGAHVWEAPQYAGLPPGTRGLDTFLGDPAFLGQGHAARYLRARAGDLARPGAPVAVDPDPANARAVAAYARAGFRGDAIVPCEDGTPVRVMTFTPA